MSMKKNERNKASDDILQLGSTHQHTRKTSTMKSSSAVVSKVRKPNTNIVATTQSSQMIWIDFFLIFTRRHLLAFSLLLGVSTKLLFPLLALKNKGKPCFFPWKKEPEETFWPFATWIYQVQWEYQDDTAFRYYFQGERKQTKIYYCSTSTEFFYLNWIFFTLDKTSPQEE